MPLPLLLACKLAVCTGTGAAVIRTLRQLTIDRRSTGRASAGRPFSHDDGVNAVRTFAIGAAVGAGLTMPCAAFASFTIAEAAAASGIVVVSLTPFYFSRTVSNHLPAAFTCTMLSSGVIHMGALEFAKRGLMAAQTFYSIVDVTWALGYGVGGWIFFELATRYAIALDYTYGVQGINSEWVVALTAFNGLLSSAMFLQSSLMSGLFVGFYHFTGCSGTFITLISMPLFLPTPLSVIAHVTPTEYERSKVIPNWLILAIGSLTFYIVSSSPLSLMVASLNLLRYEPEWRAMHALEDSPPPTQVH